MARAGKTPGKSILKTKYYPQYATLTYTPLPQSRYIILYHDSDEVVKYDGSNVQFEFEDKNAFVDYYIKFDKQRKKLNLYSLVYHLIDNEWKSVITNVNLKFSRLFIPKRVSFLVGKHVSIHRKVEKHEPSTVKELADIMNAECSSTHEFL